MRGMRDYRVPGGHSAPHIQFGGTSIMGTDPAVLLYYLQLLEPVFSFFTSFSGVILQLFFLGLDFGSFFLGFI